MLSLVVVEGTIRPRSGLIAPTITVRGSAIEPAKAGFVVSSLTCIEGTVRAFGPTSAFYSMGGC